MNLITTNLKSIIILAVVVLGLLVTVYLVKNPQIFKSRADASKFQITGSDGKSADYVCEDNDRSKCKFTTAAERITVGIQEDAIKAGKFDKATP